VNGGLVALAAEPEMPISRPPNKFRIALELRARARRRWRIFNQTGLASR